MPPPQLPDVHIWVRPDLQGEVWVPDDELGNGDRRGISIHLAGIGFA